MKDNIKGNGGDSVDDIYPISKSSGSAAGLSIGFSIEKFPKEFKKNTFSSIDFRFLIILLISFVINIFIVYFLKEYSPSTIDSIAITKIQKQFAHLLLESNQRSIIPPLDITSPDLELNTQVITGLTEWIDDLSLNIFESINGLPSFEEAGANIETAMETRGYSKEELENLRRSTAEKRLSARSELEREVESVGLLGLISSEGKNKDDYIQDLIEYASKNSDQLTTVLSKLNTIEIPRYSSKGYLQKLKGISDYGKFTNLKGERERAENIIKNIINNLASLDKAKTEEIARNVHYEEVKSSYLTKTSQSNVKRKRSSSDVIRIVRSHMRALQDCYKQELRNDPGLIGRIAVRFVVTPDGVVSQASMISSTLNNSRMESCLLARVRRWRDFPPCDPSFGNMTYRQKFAFGM